MQIKFLGTAAAEGWPGLFCDCDHCRRAVAAGGRNVRTRSQAVVDDRLLIDFGPDTYHHVLVGGLDLKSVTHCLITHSHSDHLYAKDFAMRPGVYGHRQTRHGLAIYATVPAYLLIEPVVTKNFDEEDPTTCHLIRAFQPFFAGDYAVTPLEADHGPTTEPVIYAIEKDGRSLLYAHDTGYFPDVTWQYMLEQKMVFDLVTLDCTNIQLPGRQNHMGLAACTEVKERLLAEGLAHQDTTFVVNHFSHNGGLIHDELVPVAGELGFLVAYDGCTMKV